MTPLPIDYGPGTIAYRRGQMQIRQDRLDARRRAVIRATHLLVTALCITVLVAVSVWPVLEHPAERSNTLYPSDFSILEDRK